MNDWKGWQHFFFFFRIHESRKIRRFQFPHRFLHCFNWNFECSYTSSRRQFHQFESNTELREEANNSHLWNEVWAHCWSRHNDDGKPVSLRFDCTKFQKHFGFCFKFFSVFAAVRFLRYNRLAVLQRLFQRLFRRTPMWNENSKSALKDIREFFNSLIYSRTFDNNHPVH